MMEMFQITDKVYVQAKYIKLVYKAFDKNLHTFKPEYSIMIELEDGQTFRYFDAFKDVGYRDKMFTILIRKLRSMK